MRCVRPLAGRRPATLVAAFPGFIKQTVMPPSPPAQVDWVILQRFASTATAVAWLNSEQRLKRIRRRGADAGRPRRRPHRPGRRRRRAAVAGRRWSFRPASSPARSPHTGPGSSGSPPRSRRRRAFRAIASSRRCPACRTTGWRSCASTPKPTCRPGSTRRSVRSCCEEAEPFTEEFHARIVRTGFDQWFPVPAGGAAPPAVWKMNMLVLLMLYPIVFLFGFFVQTPLPDRPRGCRSQSHCSSATS